MKKISFIFITLSLLALIVGAIFGTLAGIQYVKPDFLKEVIAFNKMRPFHVSTVIGWIILCATGGDLLLSYQYLKTKLIFKKTSRNTSYPFYCLCISYLRFICFR